MFYSAEKIRDWLTGSIPFLSDLGAHADQDAFHFIACDFTASQLIDFYKMPAILKQRQDGMAVAICHRLVWLLDPKEDPDHVESDQQRTEEIEMLVSFIRSNLTEFNTADERISLGAVYDQDILPLVMNAP